MTLTSSFIPIDPSISPIHKCRGGVCCEFDLSLPNVLPLTELSTAHIPCDFNIIPSTWSFFRPFLKVRDLPMSGLVYLNRIKSIDNELNSSEEKSEDKKIGEEIGMLFFQEDAISEDALSLTGRIALSFTHETNWRLLVSFSVICFSLSPLLVRGTIVLIMINENIAADHEIKFFDLRFLFRFIPPSMIEIQLTV